ncbi:MAG: glycosyltransferase family 39 protein [Candidatus Acidiferrales bacterium]
MKRGAKGSGRNVGKPAKSADANVVKRHGLLRRTATSLPLIVLVALLLRVGFAWDYVGQNSRQALAVLPFLQESGNIAASLASGHGFSSPFRIETGPTAWMPPAYPWLLAEIFRIFGVRTYDSFLAALALNILCSGFTCVPIYFAGKRIGGLNVAALAAWLWAFFPNTILNAFESMWEASLAALLAAIILWATLAIEKSERWREWVGYGLLWGVTLLTNVTLISLLPLLLGWLAYRRRKISLSFHDSAGVAKTTLAKPALALGVALLCCVPWTIRNYHVFHRIVPLRSTLGLQMWIGNNENPQEVWKEELHPIFNSAERARYIRMGEIEYMREKQSEAIGFILAHPGRDVRQFASRFIATWSGGTPTPLQDFVRTPGLWFRGVLLFNFVVAIGTAAGIVVLWKQRSAYLFPIAVFPLVFPWAYYLTLVVPRYRLPVDPAVMLLTAVALQAICSRQITRPE